MFAIPVFWSRSRRKELARERDKLVRDIDLFIERCPASFSEYFNDKEDLLEHQLVSQTINFLEAKIQMTGRGPAREAPALLEQQGSPADDSLIGGCRILRKIGEGGMGAVYFAHHIGLDIPMAVKILHTKEKTESCDAADRFLREARAVAKLKHPNIVGIYNVGREEEVDFLVMEYVDRGSLRDLIKKTGMLDLPTTIRIITQVCSGLQFAHDNGVIHRDIKPDNILLDAAQNAKIADLGLARIEGQDLGLTRSGTMMGTPNYLSPEQASDAKSVDHRTDVYSLGCMSYEMLCGKVPYKGSSLAEVINAHASAPIPNPQESNPSIPDNIANSVMKMIAKDPASRHESVREIAEELSRHNR